MLAPLPAHAASTPIGATVTHVEGEATVVFVKDGSAAPVVLKMAVSAGDRVRTGKNGVVEVQFDNGDVIRVDKDTDMTVRSLHRNEKGSTFSIFNLIMGRVKSSVAKLASRESKFEYHTKAAIAGVGGSPPWVVTASMDATGKSKTEVDFLGKKGEMGQLYLQGFDSGLTRITLDPGFGTTVFQGRAPAIPQLIPQSRMQSLDKGMQFKTQRPAQQQPTQQPEGAPRGGTQQQDNSQNQEGSSGGGDQQGAGGSTGGASGGSIGDGAGGSTGGTTGGTAGDFTGGTTGGTTGEANGNMTGSSTGETVSFTGTSASGGGEIITPVTQNVTTNIVVNSLSSTVSTKITGVTGGTNQDGAVVDTSTINPQAQGTAGQTTTATSTAVQTVNTNVIGGFLAPPPPSPPPPPPPPPMDTTNIPPPITGTGGTGTGGIFPPGPPPATTGPVGTPVSISIPPIGTW